MEEEEQGMEWTSVLVPTPLVWGGDFRSTHTSPAFGEERVERERE